MPVATRLRLPALAAVTVLALAACASDAESDDAASADPAGQDLDGVVEETTEAAPTEVTVTTAQGEVTVPFQPENVVIFEHGVLDTVDALGAGDSVTGIPHHALPDYLTSYTESTENTGTLFEPDYEAINALEPDLIIVGGRSAATIAEMEAIAPTIDLSYGWGSAAFQESFVSNTTAIGQIFGAEDEATAAINEVTAGVQEVATNAADAGTGLVLMTSAGEVSAYGPAEEGRFDFVYGLLGVQPAAEQVAIDTHGDAVSFEYIAELNPDLLIVLDRDAAIGTEAEAAQAVLDNDLVNGTSAVQNDKVLYVDTAKWYLSVGGLNSTKTIIDEVGSLVG